ncbi:KAT8 regulatory NSL complex subunit 1 [Labeo rohita]|uniref:KAT8 regulatory NSL complex subunit 1 n=1 Tax=Labeo rohita TaxID=84645 RepID=A0A498NHQ4_LABRO|nr:KAT8 regulatory NSL complex subunit 1 [Labeo rohita]
MQEVEQALMRNLQYPQAHKQPLKSRDLQNLAHNGHAVLHGVLEALDSDATVSSSDEEWDHDDTKGTSVESHCHVCEWRWLKDRAELCSRWTWLQMRVSELDSQIQQLGKLRQQILSNKGRVILAESQPLTDKQIQHTLWTETMDLSFTAGNMRDLHSDLEMEPSSPTRLLRNIERQSAQLTQIVNSLMPSLCASPSSSPMSKGPCNHWRGQQKTAYSGFWSLPLLFVPIVHPVILHVTTEKREQMAKCILFYHFPQKLHHPSICKVLCLKTVCFSDLSSLKLSTPDLITVSDPEAESPALYSFSSRRRNCESIFSTDDIVVPMSLFASVKVERLLYKDILTPSWRKVNISPLLKRDEDEQEERMMKISFRGTRVMSIERNYWDPTGIRTEDTASGHPGKVGLQYLRETILLTVAHLYILLFPSPGPSVLLKIHQNPVWMNKSHCNHGEDVCSP